MPDVLRARCESTSKPRLAARHRPQAAGAAFDKDRCTRPGSSHDDPFVLRPTSSSRSNEELQRVREGSTPIMASPLALGEASRIPTRSPVDQRLRGCFWCTGCANARSAWVSTHRLRAQSVAAPSPRQGNPRTSSDARPALTDFPGFTARVGRLPDGKRLAFEPAGRKPGHERTTNLLRSHPHHGHLVAHRNVCTVSPPTRMHTRRFQLWRWCASTGTRSTRGCGPSWSGSRESNIGDGRLTWRRGRDGTLGYELLVGSDPARTPRHINRWGYLREESGDSGAIVFGVMSQSDGQSC